MSFLRSIPAAEINESSLLQRYKLTGDLNIVAHLYQPYMDLVFGVCLKYLKDTEQAKDAVMQIFEELIIKLKKHEVLNFKAWLHQLAKNHCLMQLRTPRNLKTVEFNHDFVQNDEASHLNGILEKEENFKSLEDCIKTLTKEQQQAVKLFYLDGKCYNEIVETTGHDWKQVRSYIQNGKRNLKICMESRLASINT